MVRSDPTDPGDLGPGDIMVAPLTDEKDEEMKDLLKMEISELEENIPKMEETLTVALLPKDPDDDKNIMVEIRAGTGGDEAALFAGELARSYMTFAEEQGLKIEIVLFFQLS
jgi:peptide chain release factor 1